MLVFMVLAIIWNNSALAYDFCKKDRPIAHVPRADVVHTPDTSPFGLTKGSDKIGGKDSLVKPKNDGAITIPEIIYIPVTIDMAERYGLSVPAGIELESTLGMMEIYKDGKILYDGKDISGNIKDECDDFDRVLEKQISKPKPNKE
jgi:hypothetical protein